MPSSSWPGRCLYLRSEEVVYLKEPRTGAMFGLRAADGGAHHYYDVGIEHLAFEVDTVEEVDAAYERCVGNGAKIHFPPEEDRDVEGYHAFFVFDGMECGSTSSVGRDRRCDRQTIPDQPLLVDRPQRSACHANRRFRETGEPRSPQGDHLASRVGWQVTDGVIGTQRPGLVTIRYTAAITSTSAIVPIALSIMTRCRYRSEITTCPLADAAMSLSIIAFSLLSSGMK